jgi:hypothetical protein
MTALVRAAGHKITGEAAVARSWPIALKEVPANSDFWPRLVTGRTNKAGHAPVSFPRAGRDRAQLEGTVSQCTRS